MKAGRLIARLVIGGLFVGHGTQKLFGWFGGPGPEGTEQMMKSLEMHPSKQNAQAASWSEAAGGALLALGGPLTPVAGTLLNATMVTAIRKVHLSNGFWNTNGGFEFNLALMAATTALVEEEAGTGWALASLVAGAAGSTLAIEAGRRLAPEQPESERPEYPLDENEPVLADVETATA
jgi:putative oxidoreductase